MAVKSFFFFLPILFKHLKLSRFLCRREFCLGSLVRSCVWLQENKIICIFLKCYLAIGPIGCSPLPRSTRKMFDRGNLDRVWGKGSG